jgi:hypothetical protein
MAINTVIEQCFEEVRAAGYPSQKQDELPSITRTTLLDLFITLLSSTDGTLVTVKIPGGSFVITEQ